MAQPAILENEQLVAVIDEAIDLEISVTRRRALVVSIRHEITNDRLAIKLEERLQDLGFQFLSERWDPSKTYFIKEWLH